MFPRGLLQEYANTLSIIARILDVSCVFLGAILAYYWRFGDLNLPPNYNVAVILGLLVTFIVFSGSGIYTSWRGKSWFHQARVITLTWLAVVIILIISAFLLKSSTEFSRQWMAMWTLSGWASLLVFRLAFRKILQYMRSKGWNHKRIIIVGTGELARGVAGKIRQADWTGLDIVAFLDDSGECQEETIFGTKVYLGPDKLMSLVENCNIDEVWLALSLKYEDRMKKILSELEQSTVNVRFVPGIFSFRLLNHSITEVAGLPVIDLNASPMVGVNRFIKALEDRVIASVILLLISPLLVFISAGVKLTSKGPVLFKQMRHGWDGRPINVYKYRTMIMHTEGKEVTQAVKGDARITKFGAFLRRTSLDELPQFFNVLQGRMSIVGPRPHALQHNEQYKDRIEAYMQRHKVKPGITGWAQINGWRGETDTLEKMKRRVEYDMYYIENWSLWLDVKIIFLSLFTGFTHKNAY